MAGAHAVNQEEQIMSDVVRTELLRLHNRLNRLLGEFCGMPFAMMGGGETWAPAINAYRACDRIILCVDLAGVDREAVDVHVEPECVSLRGRRELPEPKIGGRAVEQILTMEINHGEFERVVKLPEAVDPNRATSTRRNGLLWIVLPLEKVLTQR
jgi:HSP20 family protein